MAGALRPLGVLALVPPLTLALFLGPVLAGMVGVLLPAFGRMPGLGDAAWSLQPWRDWLGQPGLGTALSISATSALGATILAFAAAMGLSAALHGSVWGARLRAALAPLLAVPHGAFAVGVLFLAAPSGWIARLLSPWATGWERPPDLLTVGDPAGVSLMLALAAKETVFLLLMIQAALAQVPADAHLRVARSLGYRPRTAWAKVVAPQLYRQLRLPIYAVLAYGCSVVDMALVLGPTAPPPLAVLVVQAVQDPDTARRLAGAAGAVTQGALALALILVWRAGEYAVAGLGRLWLRRGGRASADLPVGLLSGLGLVFLSSILAALILSAIWSVAEVWRFPDALPGQVSGRSWAAALPLLSLPFAHTALIGAGAVALSLLLVLGCLEGEDRRGQRAAFGALGLLYLPLLLPQPAFLPGVLVVLNATGLAGMAVAVLWMHLIFVLPYLFLTLSDAWRALDPRYARTGLTLGHSPASVFLRLKLPLLKRPILSAAAVGFAVSVGLYLPTLLAGGGRVPTLATEVVALASGGDRRLLGAFSLVQAVLPLAVLAAALALGRPRFGGGEGRVSG